MITIVNKRRHTATTRDVYIGRPSALGNPYSHLPNTIAKYKVDTRDDAIQAYRRYLYERIRAEDEAIINALLAIPKDAILVCWCRPAACHGDIIIAAVQWLRGDRSY